LICSVVTAFMYWYWRSPELITAINGSGGLDEVFSLPIMLIVPGTAIGALGALIASISHKQQRSTD